MKCLFEVGAQTCWKLLWFFVKWNLWFFLSSGELECSDDPIEYAKDNVTRCPDDVGTEVVPILLGVYILITNVLMLNLLIAMFR